MPKKVLLVAGARPNFMKIAPIISEMRRLKNEFQPIFVHTGQHYDKKMSDSFLSELNLNKPDYYLGVGSASHAVQTAKIMIEFESVVNREKPHLVIVVGDVNSTIACALVASKLYIPIAHIEAGLRSYDYKMPEEINRILTDRISNLLFTTCMDANINLYKEGISKDKVYFVGNIMIESLIKFKNRYINAHTYNQFDCKPNNYALLTLHRPSNVDNPKVFKEILSALDEISSTIPIIFPAHPRTQERIQKFKFKVNNDDQIIITNPISYFDFLSLQMNAKIVLTDSGGIQEETTYFRIPCLTLRENTERPITIHEGTNQLVNLNKQSIVDAFSNAMDIKIKNGKIPKYWDDQVSKRIIQTLIEEI